MGQMVQERKRKVAHKDDAGWTETPAKKAIQFMERMGELRQHQSTKKRRVWVAAKDQELGQGASKKASRKELMSLIESQQFRCNLTGVSLTPDEAALDHVIAVSRGGGHDIENLQVLHIAVNKMKGSMPQGEFVKWCRLVAAKANAAGDDTSQ